MAGRQGRGGVGHVAQATQVVAAHVHLLQQSKDGGHTGKAGHPLLFHALQDTGRVGKPLLQDQGAPEANGHE